MKVKIVNLFEYVVALIISVLAILSSLFITINTTAIYEYCVRGLSLVERTGIGINEIIHDYKNIIFYIQNPFIEKLNLKYFAMSEVGEIHFYEVQQIFKNIYFFTVISILLIILFIYFYNRKKEKINMLKICNYSSNIILSVFITLISAMIINFTKAFELFHKIFFNNDNWLFDPLLDPIINVLPEEVFMINGVIILTITFLFAIIIKSLYYIKRGK